MKKIIITFIIFSNIILMQSTYSNTVGSSNGIESTLSNWSKTAVNYLAYHDIVNQDLLKEFQKPIQRDEFTALLSRVYERVNSKEAEIQYKFNDIESSNYRREILVASHYSLVNGISSTKFSPSSNITREQVAVLVYRLIDKLTGIPETTVYNNNLEDKAEVSTWAKKAVSYCVDNKIIQGDGKKFYPKKPITMEAAETVIYRVVSQRSYLPQVTEDQLDEFNIDATTLLNIPAADVNQISHKSQLQNVISKINTYFNFHSDMSKDSFENSHGGQYSGYVHYIQGLVDVDGIESNDIKYMHYGFSTSVTIGYYKPIDFLKPPAFDMAEIRFTGNIDTFSDHLPKIKLYLDDITNNTEVSAHLINDFKTIKETYKNGEVPNQSPKIPSVYFPDSKLRYMTEIDNIEDRIYDLETLNKFKAKYGAYNYVTFRLYIE